MVIDNVYENGIFDEQGQAVVRELAAKPEDALYDYLTAAVALIARRANRRVVELLGLLAVTAPADDDLQAELDTILAETAVAEEPAAE